jgi:glutathione S-transferase
MPIVYGVSPSPFVRKVRVAMAEKGLDYELEPVMPGNVPESFKKISPLSKVPVYQDGELVLPDSSVIIAYLERIRPEPPLYPSDPKRYGRALWYEEYADTKLIEVVGPIFAQRFVQQVLFKQESDEAVVERQLTLMIPPVFDYLEGEVSEEGWIVGDAFSIADIAIGTAIVQLRHGGESVDAARWPRLAAYAERVLGRQSFAALIAEEEAAIERKRSP